METYLRCKINKKSKKRKTQRFDPDRFGNEPANPRRIRESRPPDTAAERPVATHSAPHTGSAGGRKMRPEAVGQPPTTYSLTATASISMRAPIGRRATS